MFDGMFNLSESFTQDFLAPPSPPPQGQQDDAGGRGVAERSLGKGVLHSTIATLHNLARSKAFEESDIKAFKSEWLYAIIVGWITEIDDTEEGVLIGQICDGTGSIDFRYELASNMPDAYLTRLQKLKPVEHNASEEAQNKVQEEDDVKSMQCPTKMIGNPTMVDNELLFVASHLKAATPDEVISTHFIESGLTALSASASTEDGGENPSEDIQSPPRAAPAKLLGVDPYFGEEVTIPEEVGPFMEGPSNRIKRVIWRFLDEASRKEFNTDRSEACVAIRSFCSKMWSDKEVDAALDGMDDDGILFYMDTTKERVALV